MGSNPSGRGAEEMRKHLPAQRARREAPQRPPAKQADPLTAHQSMLKRLASAGRFFVGLAWGRTRKGTDALQVEPALGVGESVCALLELFLVCFHAALELLCVFGRR